MTMHEITRLGDYHLVRMVGDGGIGTVWEARSVTTMETVAVRLIGGELANNDAVVARFLRDGRVLQPLRHSNIASVRELIVGEGHLGIVTDFVDGQRLRERLATSKLTAIEAVAIGQQVASGISSLHRGGVVHRDLQPSNIFVDFADSAAWPSVKIVDFAVARLLGQEVARDLAGGPGAVYHAPESSDGGAARSPADIYSLGIVLFEMFVGQTPFESSSPSGGVRLSVEQTTPTLGGVPSELADLVDRMLNVEPDKRPVASQVFLVLQEVLPQLSSDQEAYVVENRHETEPTQAMNPVVVPDASSVPIHPPPLPGQSNQGSPVSDETTYPYEGPQAYGAPIGTASTQYPGTDDQTQVYGAGPEYGGGHISGPLPAGPGQRASGGPAATKSGLSMGQTIALLVAVVVMVALGLILILKSGGTDSVDLDDVDGETAGGLAQSTEPVQETTLPIATTSVITTQTTETTVANSIIVSEWGQDFTEEGNGTFSANITFTASSCATSVWTDPFGTRFESPGWPDANVNCWERHGREFPGLAPQQNYTIQIELADIEGGAATESYSFTTPASSSGSSGGDGEAAPEISNWNSNVSANAAEITFNSSSCTNANWIGPLGQEHQSPNWPDANAQCWENHERTFTGLNPNTTYTVSVQLIDRSQQTTTGSYSFTTSS